MFKLEFDPANKALAAAIGRALTEYAGEQAPVQTLEVKLDASEVEKTLDEAAVADLGNETAAATTAEDAPAITKEQATRVDQKGVAFDPAFCANAADPFYKSGRTSGQWKKKKGVDEQAYNDWYGSQVQVEAAAEPEPEPEVDTSAAFGGGGGQTEQQQADVPADGGALMVWVSEQQAAGKLTQDDINAAYQSTGTDAAALFGPNAASVIPALFNALSAKANA